MAAVLKLELTCDRIEDMGLMLETIADQIDKGAMRSCGDLYNYEITEAEEKMTFEFGRRTHHLPEGIDQRKTFEAESRLEALQLASDYWFGGASVVSTQHQGNNIIALLSAHGNGNVIGTLIEYGN